MKHHSLFSKDFLLVVIGQIISLFGNQILRYALPLYLLNQTGSSALFGTISACSFIPMLILFPIGGIIADRANKRNIMVILDFSTAALVILFLVLVNSFDIVPLMAVTIMILYGIQGAYQPAVNASIPVLVNANHIMQANSIINVISSLANMLAPVIGGILFSILGLSPILYISAICFFFSAVLELFIHIPFDRKTFDKNIFADVLTDLRNSFHYITKEQPVIWKLSIVYALTCLLLSSLMVIAIPVIITQNLNFSPNNANRFYGYAQGVIAVGSVLGGVLAGILSKKIKPGAIPFLTVGCGLPLLVGGIALQFSNSTMITYLSIVGGCGLLMVISSLFQIQVMSYVQILSASNQIGKVISCVICICMCANPIGTFLYGIIFEKIGVYIFLPFYIAPCIVSLIVVMFRKFFLELDTEVKKRLEEEI